MNIPTRGRDKIAKNNTKENFAYFKYTICAKNNKIENIKAINKHLLFFIANFYHLNDIGASI